MSNGAEGWLAVGRQTLLLVWLTAPDTPFCIIPYANGPMLNQGMCGKLWKGEEAKLCWDGCWADESASLNSSAGSCGGCGWGGGWAGEALWGIGFVTSVLLRKGEDANHDQMPKTSQCSKVIADGTMNERLE